MTKYAPEVNVSAVRKALKSGSFGNLTWQAVCARPDLAQRILAENQKIKAFEADQTGLDCTRANSVIGRILAKGKQ